MLTQYPCSGTHCSGCSLSLYHTTKLPTASYSDRADGTVDVLIVTEFPNQQEIRGGQPVTTKGGYEIRNLMNKILPSTTVAYSSLMRCRPLENTGATREPTNEEMAACVHHLWQDIERLKPKVVVPLGILAARALNPTYERWHTNPITEISGDLVEHRGVLLFPVPSPYLWAFDEKPYKHRKNLTSLIQLLDKILHDPDSPRSRLGDHYYCSTVAEVQMVARKIRALRKTTKLKGPSDFIGVGLDTEGQNVFRIAENGISCIQLAPTEDIGYLIPLDHHDSPWTREERREVGDILADLFTDETLDIDCWVAHESKFDINQVLRHLGVDYMAKPVVDPIFLMYLSDENMRAKSEDGSDNDSFRSSFSLKSLSKLILNYRHYDTEILEHRTKPEGFWRLPMNADRYQPGTKEHALAVKYTEYSCMDGYVALRLAKAINEEMHSRGYTKAFNIAKHFGYRTAHFIRNMEHNGIAIDRDMLSFLSGDQSPILARTNLIPTEIYESPEAQEANTRLVTKADGKSATGGMKPLFGRTLKVFDVRKKDHLLTLFCDVCKLEPVETAAQLERSKKPPSIGKEFYAKHDYHPLVQVMQEYTGLSKLRSSYVNAIDKYLNPIEYPDNADGRIHARFDTTKTFTGRLASSYPSLHQIPRADNFAKACIKSMIAAGIGYCLMESDYGQAEVRWWAQISDDQDFIDMFWRMYEIQEEYYRNPTPENKKRKKLECDIHLQVASLMYGIPLADVTKAQRQSAKSIVFGAIYGQSARALAQVLKISEAEAEELQAKFIGRFTKAGPWLLDIEKFARTHGYVESPFGRRRHLGPLYESDPSGTDRQARNSPIQEAASSAMAEAVFLQQRWIEQVGHHRTKDVRLVDTVHDAMLQEIRIDRDLILATIQKTRANMSDDIGAVLKRDYGIHLKVPLVADFKLGLRWGHAEDWDQGTDIDTVMDMIQGQTDRLRSGTPFWKIAAEEELDIAREEVTKVQSKLTSATGKDKIKLQAQLSRVKEHALYVERLVA